MPEILPSALIPDGDAGAPGGAEELAATVARERGLEGLRPNAGYAGTSPVEEVDADFFDRMTNINVHLPALGGPVGRRLLLPWHAEAGITSPRGD